MQLERLCARVLARVEDTLRSVRAVLEEEVVDKRWRGVLHALCLGVLRNYRLLEHMLKYCGYRGRLRGTAAGWLPLVVAYEAVFRKEFVRRTALRYAAPRLGDTIDCLVEVSVNDVVAGVKGSKRLSILYSVPEWVVDFLEKAGPPGGVEELLKAFQQPTPEWIRFNKSRISLDNALRILRDSGVDARPDPVLDDVVEVVSAKPGSIPLLDQSLFYVQDRSAALVAHVLGEEPGRVVDVFSAPGNKIAHLEWRSPRLSAAIDIAPARAYTEARLLKMQGVVGVEVVVGDARLPPLRRNHFDAALVDPDCSSIGRIGHSPETRLFLEKAGPSIVYRLSRLQLRGLRMAAELVRRGGIVVYSTCTLTVEENEGVVSRAVGEGLFEVEEARPLIGVWSPLLKGTQRIYPHVSRCGGGFVARLRRL